MFWHTYLNHKRKLLAFILVSFNNFVDFPLCYQLFFGAHFLQIYSQLSKVVRISNPEAGIITVEFDEMFSYFECKSSLHDSKC